MVWVFSLSALDLSTQRLTPEYMSQHSEFVWIWQAMKPPHPISSSTSMTLTSRLFLKTFRGVRAISQFDQPFTPTHNSSKDFSTSTGSVLHSVLPELQPGHGQITRFRVYPLSLYALFRLAFASAAELKSLTLLERSNSQAHYAKGTQSRHEAAPTACKRMVSGSISLRYSRFFSPFLHSTGSLSVSQKYLALPDGAGGFPQGVSDLAVLRILLCNIFNSCTGLSPSMIQLSRRFHFKNIVNIVVLQPHKCLNICGLG